MFDSLSAEKLKATTNKAYPVRAHGIATAVVGTHVAFERRRRN
jgi:hypothetical protein